MFPEKKFLVYDYLEKDINQINDLALSLRQQMETRRSIRFFSNKPIPREIIKNIIMTASSAPSGANKQPWTFCVVTNPDLKEQIRRAAEEEEYLNYNGRMSSQWLKDLEQFDTNWSKPFLTTAPYLIVLFKRIYENLEDGENHKNYYVNESVGIAAGFLITAIHLAGLVTLTHTPSPMNFLQKILKRPDNERPFLLLPVGYPAEDALVPVLNKKTADQTIIWYE